MYQFLPAGCPPLLAWHLLATGGSVRFSSASFRSAGLVLVGCWPHLSGAGRLRFVHLSGAWGRLGFEGRLPLLVPRTLPPSPSFVGLTPIGPFPLSVDVRLPTTTTRQGEGGVPPSPPSPRLCRVGSCQTPPWAVRGCGEVRSRHSSHVARVWLVDKIRSLPPAAGHPCRRPAPASCPRTLASEQRWLERCFMAGLGLRTVSASPCVICHKTGRPRRRRPERTPTGDLRSPVDPEPKRGRSGLIRPLGSHEGAHTHSVDPPAGGAKAIPPTSRVPTIPPV